MAKILIIDDAKFSRSQISAIMKEAEHETLEATNGHEGLKMAIEYKPNCIISDLLMPEMDGIALLAALRDKNINIPVIVVTANIQETMRQQCLNLNVAEFINKPPKREELKQIVEKILHSRDTNNG